MTISNDAGFPIKGKISEKEQFAELLFPGLGVKKDFLRRLVILLLTLLFYSYSIHAQYIKEILEYRPAPGQFINLSSTGTPEAAQSIIGEDPGMVSLGSAGGYIVFRFDGPVINDPANPFGVDFTLFGNSLPQWAEPAAVYVMKDQNGNSLPDDKWFLLAGSDYYFSTSHKDHQIKYYQPGSVMEDIAWRNSLGETGFVKRNSYYEQDYYPAERFPGYFYDDSCSFSFLKIEGKLETGSSTGVKSYPRAFGFADNKPKAFTDHIFPDNPYTNEAEGYGGDGFDLSWAVTENGDYIELDTADFVRVQTAMYGNSEAVGEVSSELKGGILTLADPSLTGRSEMLVIEDVPADIPPGQYQLKVYFFKNGRPVDDVNINWVSSNPATEISSEGRIEIEDNTHTEVHATARNGEIISNTVILNGATITSLSSNYFHEEAIIFPNPSNKNIFLRESIKGEVCIYDMNGVLIRDYGTTGHGKAIDISFLHPGIYLIKIQEKRKPKHVILIKN